MRVNATFGNTESCFGTLTDWNMKSCNARSKLTLTLDSCKNKEIEGKEILSYGQLYSSLGIYVTLSYIQLSQHLN